MTDPAGDSPWPPNVLAVFGAAYLEGLRRTHPNPYRRTGVAAWLLADDPVARTRLAELDRWLGAARRHDLVTRDAMRRLKRGQVFVFLPKILEFAALHFLEERLGLHASPGESADFEVKLKTGESIDVEVKAPISATAAAFRRLVHAAGKRAKRPTVVLLASTEIAAGFEAQAAARSLREGRPAGTVLGVCLLRIGFGPRGAEYAHAFEPRSGSTVAASFR